MKKTVLTSFTTLCLLSTAFLIGLALNIRPAGASETIYIKADGSVEGTTKIQREGNIYTFSDDINGSVTVEKDNITIDGTGHCLGGSGADDLPGLDLTGRSRVVVRNLELREFEWWGVLLISSSNNTLTGNNVTQCGFGIYLENSTDNVFSVNNIVENEWNGISLEWGSSDNKVCDSNFTANGDYGIFTLTSNGNWISGNAINRGGNGGIVISESSHTAILDNNVSQSYPGILLQNSSHNVISANEVLDNYGKGIVLENGCKNNTISENNIAACMHASISIILSDNNRIYGNNLTSNYIGIYLGSCSGNVIYHNSFVDNTIHVECDSANNTWDDEYPSGGNYWSDYEERYPNAQEIDGSDVWDTPYVIDGNNQDNYPIIPEFPSSIILPLFMMATLLAAILHRRKHPCMHKQ